MTRVLVVNYHFPPDGSVGGLRWSGFGKYLAQAGWDVHVLTAAVDTSPTDAGVTVHECPRFRTLNDVYRRLKRTRRREGRRGEGPADDREGMLLFLRREIASLMSFPDESRGWLMRAAICVQSLRRRVRPDVIVTSGPPHSAHLAGLLGRAGSRTPFVIDLRDPWANPSRAWQNHPIYGRRVARVLVRRMERMALHRAQGAVANTVALKEWLQAKYPGLTATWIPNGVDLERIPSATGPPHPGLSVVHVGTLYGGRDPTDVVIAFAKLLERRPDLARAGSKLRFAGRIEPVHLARLRSAMSRAAMEAHVEILGLVSSDDALTLLQRSQVAVVLAQDQELQVPGKLFEAVGLGKPTIVVAEADSASAGEAARLGARWVAPGDAARLADLFGQLGSVPDGIGVDRAAISYRALARDMDRFLRDVIENGSPPPSSSS